VFPAGLFSLALARLGCGDLLRGIRGLGRVGDRDPCSVGRVRISWDCERKSREGERPCACTGAWLIARDPIADPTEVLHITTRHAARLRGPGPAVGPGAENQVLRL
jgi:hypothetical protein